MPLCEKVQDSILRGLVSNKNISMISPRMLSSQFSTTVRHPAVYGLLPCAAMLHNGLCQYITTNIFQQISLTNILTAADVTDDLEKRRSASLNFLFRLSALLFVFLKSKGQQKKKITMDKQCNQTIFINSDLKLMKHSFKTHKYSSKSDKYSTKAAKQ